MLGSLTRGSRGAQRFLGLLSATAAVLAMAACSTHHRHSDAQIGSVPLSITSDTSTEPTPTSTSAAATATSVAPTQVAADHTVSHSTAVAELATLAVHPAASMAGYQRAAFGPAWTDDNDDPDGHNGCDTRNDILRRDLTDISDPGGCVVRSGTLHDPYTGTVIHFVRGVQTSNAVQIDHVVALGDAWQTGAATWSTRERTDLANDPIELLAVDGPVNERKGDADAASFEPPNAGYDCAYVARQIAVKVRYRLWVTPDEHDAMAATLQRCPGELAPSEAGSPSSSTGGSTPPSSGVPVPVPASSRPTSPTALSCSAGVDDASPAQYSTIHVVVHTSSGAAVTATAHYKTTQTSHSGQAAADGSASIAFAISRATAGFHVIVDITVALGGRTNQCSTGFTPQ